MKRKVGTMRVVFADGETNDVDASECRVWSKPDETAWRKSRAASSRHVEAANRQSAHCAVEQLDVATEEKLARWPSAKKASESLPSVADSADVIACCRGQQPQAGGYKWRFADPRPKVDAADIDERVARVASLGPAFLPAVPGGRARDVPVLVVTGPPSRLITMDYAIEIQKDNPKKAGTKSADLYEAYKVATSIKEMLSLGGRRGDIAYDIGHGWITFPDPELARRFSGLAEEKPARPEDRLFQSAKDLPAPPSSRSDSEQPDDDDDQF